MEELRNEKEAMEHRSHKTNKQLSYGSGLKRNKQTQQSNADVAQSELLKEKQMGGPLNCTNSELDIYLRELEAGYLPTSCSGINQSLLSKSKTIREKYWSKDKPMDSCHSSRPLQTLKSSTANPGEDQLTFFAEDSPAKTSVRRVKEQELPANVRAYGKNMRDSLARCNLSLSLPKTLHCFALGDLELSSKTWPRWGIMLDGELSELGTSVRPTSEPECGSWPTPTCQETEHPNAVLTSTGRRLSKNGKSSHSLNLADSVMRWPTPLRSDWKRRGPNSKQQGLPEKVRSKETIINTPTQQKSQLNPSWVEILMGWPRNWTNIKHSTSTDFNKWLVSWNKKEKHTKKTVPNMLKLDKSKEIQKETEKFKDIPTEEILISFLCEYETGNNQTGIALQGKEISEEKMQVLWDWGKASDSPYRKELQKRCGGELSEFVHLVSQVYPSYGQKAWDDGTWEFTTPRVAHSIKNRVDRIKAIGNGQVPKCAVEAFNILSKGLI